MLFRRLGRIVLSCFAILTLTSCVVINKGTIMFIEDIKESGLSVQFNNYDLRDKCELTLNKGDVVQVDVRREGGTIGLTVKGKKGNEPYTGNDLTSGVFTFRISETDDYLFWFKGTSATGKVIIKNLGSDLD